MPDRYATLAEQLNRLVEELQRQALWSECAPSPEALASTAPFCYDTLALNEWLQWVFVPQLRHMISLEAPLPGNCAIAPMAELAFAELDADCAALIDLLEAIDSTFSEAGGPSQ